MKSRIAVSALFVLIAAIVTTSHATGLLEKFKVLQASWADEISERRPVRVLDRLTSVGSALLSETRGYEDTLTMIRLDGDRLLINHCCTAGNQPCTVRTISSAVHTITFTLLDPTHFLGSCAGHMQRLVLNLIDSDHQGE
jgi:hypothetical protein